MMADVAILQVMTRISAYRIIVSCIRRTTDGRLCEQVEPLSPLDRM